MIKCEQQSQQALNNLLRTHALTIVTHVIQSRFAKGRCQWTIHHQRTCVPPNCLYTQKLMLNTGQPFFGVVQQLSILKQIRAHCYGSCQPVAPNLFSNWLATNNQRGQHIRATGGTTIARTCLEPVRLGHTYPPLRHGPTPSKRHLRNSRKMGPSQTTCASNPALQSPKLIVEPSAVQNWATSLDEADTGGPIIHVTHDQSEPHPTSPYHLGEDAR